MIQIAIVEDDSKYAQEIQSFINRYKIDKGLSIETHSFKTADDFLKEFKPGYYQMIFLDIEMPGTNGMQAAKIIREKDDKTFLFFVTNLSQYALESYEVHAFNFMVKPIDYDNFVLKVERAISMIKSDADQKIIIKIRDKRRDGYAEKIFTVADIKYVEVYNHQIIYHTIDGSFEVREGTMKTVCEKLGPYGFFMCDQSYLVNLKYVNKINKEDCIVGSDVIKISRRKKSEFLLAVAQYISFGTLKK